MAGPIIAVDPGTQKCGVAVVERTGTLLWRSVEPAAVIVQVLHGLAEAHPGARLIVGDGTGSAAFVAHLRKKGLHESLGEPILVDERGSSEEARHRYLLEHRRGWRRLLPVGLQTPGEPIDHYVAEVLAHRYLEGAAGPIDV